jgi:hypothetical protein
MYLPLLKSLLRLQVTAAMQCPGSCMIATSIMTSDATAPNGDRGVDGLLSVLAQEVTEAITDPTGQQWWERASGNENGDKCAWQFGTVFANGAGRKYETCFPDNRCYLLQTNWLKSGGCAITA